MNSALRAQLEQLPNEEKEKLIEQLKDSLKPEPYTREDAVRDLSKLPQAMHIDDFDMHHWLDKIMEYDPERLQWHVRRLGGFGGSEIGTLWMALRDQFHPFHSCTDVVLTKFLKAEPLEPVGNLLRGSMLEDAVMRPLFRMQMTKRYEAEGKTVRFRDDLFGLFMNYKDKDPELGWLMGSPDEIMEVDGKLIIIDYKAPTSGTIESLKRYPKNAAPIYYEAQLHHYTTIAQKVGMAVGGLMLASLDNDKFDFDLRDIPLRADFQQELLDAGTYYWKNYVLTGQIPPPSSTKSYSKEMRVSPQMEQDACEYATLSKMRNMIDARIKSLREAVENTTVDEDTSVDIIQNGMVNFEFKRTFDIEKMVEYLTNFGYDAELEEARVKNDFDNNALIAFVKQAVQVTDSNDDALDKFRQKGDKGEAEHWDVAKLVKIMREKNIPVANFLLRSSCGMALSRSKTGAGPLINEQLAAAVDPLIDEAATHLQGVYKEVYTKNIEMLTQKAKAGPKPKV
jgi:hypothetical protein